MSRWPPARKAGVDTVQVEGRPSRRRGHRHLDDLPAQQRRHAQERHVGRGRQDHRAARAGKQGDRRFEALDDVGQGADPVRVHGPAVTAGQPRRDGLGHLPRRVGGEIPEVLPRDHLAQRHLDLGGGAEIHFGDERAEYIRAGVGPFEAAPAAQFGDGDAVERLGQRGHRGPGPAGAASTRRGAGRCSEPRATTSSTWRRTETCPRVHDLRATRVQSHDHLFQRITEELAHCQRVHVHRRTYVYARGGDVLHPAPPTPPAGTAVRHVAVTSPSAGACSAGRQPGGNDPGSVTARRRGISSLRAPVSSAPAW